MFSCHRIECFKGSASPCDKILDGENLNSLKFSRALPDNSRDMTSFRITPRSEFVASRQGRMFNSKWMIDIIKIITDAILVNFTQINVRLLHTDQYIK